jgi:DNA gyrase subunit A
MLALVDNQPKVLNLKEILSEYIKHRKIVVIRRTQYELDQAEKKAHILEGLKIALDFIDEVIKIIRASKTVDEARQGLIKRFQLTEIQANAILDMRLQKLTSLEVQKIIEELEELGIRIKDYKDILSNEKRQYKLISSELGDVIKAYPGKRVTEVDHSSVDTTKFEVHELIAEEDVMVTITEDGFIRRTQLDTFRRQKRGGKGVKAGGKKEDLIRLMRLTSTHDYLLLFSNKGKIFSFKVLELADQSKDARGKSLKAILNLSTDEKITAITSAKEFSDKSAIVMQSKEGILKKSNLDVFSNVKKNGIIAVNLRKEDELISVQQVNPEDDIIIATKDGLALRTNLSKMRSQGRAASGIIGIRLDEGDYVIGMDVVKKNSHLFVISEKGFGKKMDYSNFIAKGRGGKGMTYTKITDKNGPAVGICTITDDDDVFLGTESGMTIRFNGSEIPAIGRSTVGVKLVSVEADDKVKNVAVMRDK